MGSLLQLTRDWRDLAVLLWEAGGELTPETEAEMHALARAVTTKVDGCVEFLKAIDYEVKGVEQAEQELARRRDGLLAAKERFRGYLLAVLNEQPERKLKGEHRSLAVRVASKRKVTVLETDPNAWPETYRKVVTTTTLDSARIREALEAMAVHPLQPVGLVGTDGDDLARLEPATEYVDAR